MNFKLSADVEDTVLPVVRVEEEVRDSEKVAVKVGVLSEDMEVIVVASEVDSEVLLPVVDLEEIVVVSEEIVDLVVTVPPMVVVRIDYHAPMVNKVVSLGVETRINIQEDSVLVEGLVGRQPPLVRGKTYKMDGKSTSTGRC